MKFGSITTSIIADGLVFNMDAANRASTKPISTITTSFNTIDTNVSGAFSDNGIFDSSTITPSFAFGGTDDNIDIDSFNLGTNNTISMWYNSTGATPNYFTPLGNDDAPNDYAVWMSYNTNAYYKVEDPSNGYVQWSTSNYNDGNWHNLSFSRVNQTVNLYIDGVVQTVSNNTLANNNTIIDKIGSKSNNTDWFEGNISTLHFYNRALSANEVLHNYNALKGRFGLT
jgi:hypothetical protein